MWRSALTALTLLALSATVGACGSDDVDEPAAAAAPLTTAAPAPPTAAPEAVATTERGPIAAAVLANLLREPAGAMDARPATTPLVEARAPFVEAVNDGLTMAYTVYEARDGWCTTMYVEAAPGTELPDMGQGSSCTRTAAVPTTLSLSAGSVFRGAAWVHGVIAAEADRVEVQLDDGSVTSHPAAGVPLSWRPELQAFVADVHGTIADVRTYAGDRELPLEQQVVGLGR